MHGSLFNTIKSITDKYTKYNNEMNFKTTPDNAISTRGCPLDPFCEACGSYSVSIVAYIFVWCLSKVFIFEIDILLRGRMISGENIIQARCQKNLFLKELHYDLKPFLIISKSVPCPYFVPICIFYFQPIGANSILGWDGLIFKTMIAATKFHELSTILTYTCLCDCVQLPSK